MPRSGPRTVHRYTLEFKIQAVKLANHPEIQTQDVVPKRDAHLFPRYVKMCAFLFQSLLFSTGERQSLGG